MTKPAPLPPVLDLPPMTPPVTVVGDVHLTPEEPEVVRRFLAFVAERAKGETLVLLGDIFDRWIGRRQEREPLAREVLARLREAVARGVRLTFLAGNRDYAFDGATDLPIELWPDVVRTTWGERRVVLSHGDLLCADDRSYLRMRAWLRSKPARGLLKSLPYAASSYLADGLRDLSNRATRRKSGRQMGIDYGLARRWLDEYEADTLVVGHVHTGVHHRLPGAPEKDVYVLKDWERQTSAVFWDVSYGVRLANTPFA